jgi:hypothetical protein
MSNHLRFASLINRQKESGLTVKMFCANEGIPESSFYYWQHRIKKESKEKQFIPLVVKPAGTRAHRSNQEEPVKLCSDNFLIEISYPNGINLRIKNDLELDQLRALVSLLD